MTEWSDWSDDEMENRLLSHGVPEHVARHYITHRDDAEFADLIALALSL